MNTAQENASGAEAPEVDPLARPRHAPEGIRASLEAVRSAQAAARARARSETRWARGIAAGAVMIVGVTAWAAAHRPARAHAAAPRVAVAPVAAPPIAPPPREAPPAEQPTPAPVAAATERPVAATPADAGERAASCDAAFAQRSWTGIASTCAAAFEARPSDSALAMRVAQAQHRRGYIATAAEWARKALAVDADIPEAYVIVAHAERNAGQAQAAAEAYRHYLALAPHGWHAAEARRALRAER
jgi:hypothetical protein